MCKCWISIIKIFHPHNGKTTALEDFCDGSLCRSHPLFSIDSSAIQLLVYYDDVEVTNPLGSAATVHKLGEITTVRIIIYM